MVLPVSMVKTSSQKGKKDKTFKTRWYDNHFKINVLDYKHKLGNLHGRTFYYTAKNPSISLNASNHTCYSHHCY